MRTKFSLFLLFALLPATPLLAGEADNSLDTLMQALAANGDSKAYFTETRTSRLTRKPIESSGTLAFVFPDNLIRQIEKPKAVLFEVQGDRVIISRNGKAQSRSLAQLGAARAFIESLRATLAGDQQALQQYYRLALTADGHSWQLVLTPQDHALAKKISQIQISGDFYSSDAVAERQARVTVVEVIERNGSRTVTQLMAIQ
ncbi:MAG: outer membrane lipoprotein carrier protein LolA [Xanthomonadales bacterium]|nr:outer membrane lipoprotein carrier protein LolA [Xanthomonadales bacterium]